MMVSLNPTVAVKVVVVLSVQYATVPLLEADLQKGRLLNHKAMLLQMLRPDQRTLASLLVISEEEEVDITHMAGEMRYIQAFPGLYSGFGGTDPRQWCSRETEPFSNRVFAVKTQR